MKPGVKAKIWSSPIGKFLKTSLAVMPIHRQQSSFSDLPLIPLMSVSRRITVVKIFKLTKLRIWQKGTSIKNEHIVTETQFTFEYASLVMADLKSGSSKSQVLNERF